MTFEYLRVYHVTAPEEIHVVKVLSIVNDRYDIEFADGIKRPICIDPRYWVIVDKLDIDEMQFRLLQ